MLRRRLLTTLRAEPEIDLEGLRLEFPDIKVRALKHALLQLAAQGLVEMHMPGRYRCLAKAPKASEPTISTIDPSPFIQPPSKARLMGGR
jgi:hypothetical protein